MITTHGLMAPLIPFLARRDAERGPDVRWVASSGRDSDAHHPRFAHRTESSSPFGLSANGPLSSAGNLSRIAISGGGDRTRKITRGLNNDGIVSSPVCYFDLEHAGLRSRPINGVSLPQGGSPALVQLGAAATAPVGPSVFARPVGFAACDAAPSAPFVCRYSFSWSPADVPFPAAAGASGDPAFASQSACPAAAGISCRFRRCRYLEA